MKKKDGCKNTSDYLEVYNLDVAHFIKAIENY